MYSQVCNCFYQQIENGYVANQIHGFKIDYGKFIPIKSSVIGRAAVTKVNLEGANYFTMLIFPYGVKSLEDHTLRKFF